jgi:hypothetical protein
MRQRRSYRLGPESKQQLTVGATIARKRRSAASMRPPDREACGAIKFDAYTMTV